MALREKELEYKASFYNIVLALAGSACKGDVECLYQILLRSKVEDDTLGFWIYDLKNDAEMYSPKFRSSLGFSDESDFPNLPSSWKNRLSPEQVKRAEEMLDLHVVSGGKHPYSIEVEYRKKDGSPLRLLCHGVITHWEGVETPTPRIMVGVHLDIS